jgi:hypothetical protein
MVGESACPFTLLPHRYSLLIQTLPVNYVRLIDFHAYVLRASYNHLMYCMLPKTVATYFTKNKFLHPLNYF